MQVEPLATTGARDGAVDSATSDGTVAAVARGASLGRRLILIAAAAIIVALLAAGLAIGAVLHRYVSGLVQDQLDAQLLSLAGTIDVHPDGTLEMARALDGPPFDRSLSGWYWQVRAPEDIAVSRSLAGFVLDLPPALAPDRSPVSVDTRGPRGEALQVRMRSVLPSGSDDPVELAATAPATTAQQAFSATLTTLLVTLGLLGAALVGAVALQVRLGLVPLQRLARDLSHVRDGTLERIGGPQPPEVAALVDEVNALLVHNESVLRGARAHVANLAHGLKTPLATLAVELEGEQLDASARQRLATIVASMDRQVRHHLRRARSTALGEGVWLRASPAESLDGILLAMRAIYAGRALSFDVAAEGSVHVACDSQDLDEMLGNLLDNACRWAHAKVSVQVSAEAGQVRIAVEDDGPGLAPEAIERAMRRGERLDESGPGTGFGLPITAELAALYGGQLDLDRSALGGLRATLRLRRAASSVRG